MKMEMNKYGSKMKMKMENEKSGAKKLKREINSFEIIARSLFRSSFFKYVIPRVLHLCLFPIHIHIQLF